MSRHVRCSAFSHRPQPDLALDALELTPGAGKAIGFGEALYHLGAEGYDKVTGDEEHFEEHQQELAKTLPGLVLPHPFAHYAD